MDNREVIIQPIFGFIRLVKTDEQLYLIELGDEIIACKNRDDAEWRYRLIMLAIIGKR